MKFAKTLWFVLLSCALVPSAEAGKKPPQVPEEVQLAPGEIRIVNYLGEPVPGVLVSDDGTGHTLGTTDERGMVTLPLDLAPTTVLRLEDKVPEDDTGYTRRVVLGETDPGVTDSRVKVMLHPGDDPATYAMLYAADGRMYKADGTSYLVLSPELQQYVNRFQAVANYWTSVGEPVVLGDPPADGSGQVVQVGLNPADPYFLQNPTWGAYAAMTTDSFTGLSRTARVVFREFGEWNSYDKDAKHEIGHVRALKHHESVGLMNPRGTSTALTESELLRVRQRHFRKPLNILTDNAPGTVLLPTSEGDEEIVFICGDDHP